MQDRWVGIAILIVGGVMFKETFNCFVVDWVPLGMAFWPRILLGFLGAYAVYFIIYGSLDEGPFNSLEWRAFAFLLGAIVYALMWNILGYLLATPLFLFAFSVSLGGIHRKALVTAGIVALVGTFTTYLIFKELLFVQLPEGIWGPLL